jgi:molecular chaperone GrpE
MTDEKQAEMTSEATPENEADTANVENVAEEATATEESGTEEVSEEAALIAQLREELAAAQAKADEYLDKFQRSAAEFQNSRRRLENQMADEIERASGALIKRFLPVLDDIDLAFQNVPEELQDAEANEAATAQAAWLQGFRQIRKKLLDTMVDQGLERIDTSGEFDPNLHEAISSEPSDSVESGHIIAEMRAGYTYKGKVLRPALVRVAS